MINVNASSSLAGWESTSVTSQAMPTSSTNKTFVVDVSKNFLAADTVQATATAAAIPTGILGVVSSYSGNSLVITPSNSIANNLTLAGVYGRIWSKTSVVNGTGTKTFVVSGEAAHLAGLTVGLAIKVYARTGPFANFMTGVVASWTPATATLVLTIATATGSSTLTDWIICQDGTFTAWDISPAWGDTLVIAGANVLTVSQTPKMKHKFINALTNGIVSLVNASTSTPLIFETNEPTGVAAPSDTGQRFEQNAIFRTRGATITIGTGTNTANQSFNLPTGVDFPAYIEVETASGSGVFESWHVICLDYSDKVKPAWYYSKSKVTNQSWMGKTLFVKCSTATVECGDGTNAALIPTGAKVNCPNIYIDCDYPAPVTLAVALFDSTSSTSSSIIASTGTITMTIGTGLPYGVGRAIKIQRTSDPSIWMTATIATYNSGTGAMTATSTGSEGIAGTYTDWTILDAIGLTLNSADSNSGSIGTTAWRGYVNGEYMTGSRTGNAVTSLSRNWHQTIGHGLNHTVGSYVWYTLDANGTNNPGVRGMQFDLNASGSIDCEYTNFGPGVVGNIVDPAYVRLYKSGIASWLYVSPSQGNADLQYVNIPSVNISPQNGNLAGLRLISVLGNVTCKYVRTDVVANDTGTSNAASFYFQNCPNIEIVQPEAWLWERRRGFSVMIFDACGFTTVPINLRLVGAQVQFSSINNVEFDGIQYADMPDGAISVSGTQAISLSRISNVIVRNWTGIGNTKLMANNLVSSDSFSTGFILNGVDFSAGNNATSVTSICTGAGAGYTFANIKMGLPSATFVNTQNKATSSLGEKNTTYRNVRSTLDGTVGTGNGLPYSTGVRLDYMVTGMMRMASAGGSNTSYKDCANFYTTVNTTLSSGRLCIGAFSGQSALDLYTLTGTAYINNQGRLYIETSGDSAIVKCPYPIRSVNSFINVDPMIWDYRSDTTSNTSNTVSITQLTFIVGSGLGYVTGDLVRIQLATGGPVYMSGTVVSYASTTLVVDVAKIFGSGTYSNWILTSPASMSDYNREFRYCQWGDDITASSWTTLNGINLAAITVDNNYVGIEMQVRFTAQSTLVGRYVDQLQLYTNNDSNWTPAASSTFLNVAGSTPGALVAAITIPRTEINKKTADGSGNSKLELPFYADGITRSVKLVARKYGYLESIQTFNYYRNDVSISAPNAVDTNISLSYGAAAAITGVSVSEHAPVTWNGKQYSITVVGNKTTNPSLTLSDIKHYLQYRITQSATLGGYPGYTWHNMVPMSGTETVKDVYGVRVVDETGAAFTGVTRHQSDDGSYYVPPMLKTGTISGHATNTRIILYNVNTNSVLYDNIATGTLTFNYYEGSGYTTGDVLQIYNIWYSDTSSTKKEMMTVTVGASGWSASIIQTTDPIYVAYYNTFATTGLAVYTSGDFVKDGANLQIDIDDPDGNWYANRMYQWDKYQIWFNSGNRDIFLKLTAQDAANIDLGGWNLDNRRSATVKQQDAINITSNGIIGPVVNPTSGGGGVTMYSGGKILTTSSGGLAPSEAQIRAWVRSELATEMARIDVATSSIPASVRTNLSTELGRIDAAITSRNAVTPPEASAIAAATRTELAPELATIGLIPAAL